MDAFLPSDYEAPKTNSNYMKIQDGENKLRILCSPIIGWEDWRDKKPVRFRRDQKPEKPIDASKPIRHFWAMIVWNYAMGKIQILEITQATIRHRIEELSKDREWGSPYKYDIKIIKSGSDQQTKYVVNPSPMKELDPAVKSEFYRTPIQLDELYRSGDPFAAMDSDRTKAFWELEMAPNTPSTPVEELISPAQAKEIESQIAKNIAPVDPFWMESALKAFKIPSFDGLKRKFYDLMLKRIEEKKKSLAEEEIPF